MELARCQGGDDEFKGVPSNEIGYLEFQRGTKYKELLTAIIKAMNSIDGATDWPDFANLQSALELMRSQLDRGNTLQREFELQEKKFRALNALTHSFLASTVCILLLRSDKNNFSYILLF